MANINDFSIEELRAIVLKQQKKINEDKIKIEELENSIKNWKEAMWRWKTKALDIKNETEECNVGIKINIKGKYEGDEIIYRVDTTYGSCMEHSTIQIIFGRMIKEELLEVFPQLKSLIKESSFLTVSRCFKGQEFWSIELKEKEQAKTKLFNGLVDIGYVLDKEKNILVRQDIVELKKEIDCF